MSARRIARELAVIVLPQLPRDKSRLDKIALAALISKAVQMLVDYGKQSIADADALRVRASQQLVDLEADHPDNANNIDELTPVPVKTDQLRQQLDLIERAINLVSEALEMPEISLKAGGKTSKITCKRCANVIEHHVEHVEESDVMEFLRRLLTAYQENRERIDQLLRQTKAKWKIERMVSIDRDILRLACAEAFFMPDIPLRVSINEAVELCHRFADEKAAKFINGILADISVQAEHYRAKGTFLETSDDEDGHGDGEGESFPAAQQENQ
jgi:N utilization substance protein B